MRASDLKHTYCAALYLHIIWIIQYFPLVICVLSGYWINLWCESRNFQHINKHRMWLYTHGNILRDKYYVTLYRGFIYSAMCCGIEIKTYIHTFMYINTIGSEGHLVVTFHITTTSSDSSGALSPATRPSQSRSTHKLLLLQPLWILRTQLSLRPHTLSSSHTIHKDHSLQLLREEDISVHRDSLHQLWVSDAAHPVERAAGTPVLFRGGAASSLLHVHVLEWTR